MVQNRSVGQFYFTLVSFEIDKNPLPKISKQIRARVAATRFILGSPSLTSLHARGLRTSTRPPTHTHTVPALSPAPRISGVYLPLYEPFACLPFVVMNTTAHGQLHSACVPRSSLLRRVSALCTYPLFVNHSLLWLGWGVRIGFDFAMADKKIASRDVHNLGHRLKEERRTAATVEERLVILLTKVL